MPSSHLEHFRTLPSDLGVVSGEKWGDERAQRANAWVSLRRTEPNLLGTHRPAAAGHPVVRVVRKGH